MTAVEELNGIVMSEISILNNSPNERPQTTCVVCDDLSDGPHFGVYTCRACAAFFRRTVTLKLEYACRASSKCDIHKSARNMCRSCRFQKCLRLGMLVTAVQQTRDVIGKRNTPTKTRSDRQMWKVDGGGFNSPGDVPAWIGAGDAHPVTTRLSELEISPKKSLNGVSTLKMRILPRILEGYHHYLSIRKASFSLAGGSGWGTGSTDNDSVDHTLRRSNFDLVRQVCRMESHIATDIVNNYFIPFKELPPEEKIVLFKNFFCYYTSAERAYQSYRAFGRDPHNDRLMMPDGGYIKMSELEKFYENTVNCKADPKEAARIFQPAMNFIVNILVDHMTRTSMDDHEFAAILAMFLWNDSLSNVAPETVKVIWSTRSVIFEDLHIHYKSRGLSDMETSVKLGNLMLFVPKMQRSVAMFRENFQLAELFNIFTADQCCAAFRPE